METIPEEIGVGKVSDDITSHTYSKGSLDAHETQEYHPHAS